MELRAPEQKDHGLLDWLYHQYLLCHEYSVQQVPFSSVLLLHLIPVSALLVEA